MKALFVKAGLMCEFEDVSQGWIALALVLSIGLFTGIFFATLN